MTTQAKPAIAVGQASCLGRGATYGWEYGDPMEILARAGFDCADVVAPPPGARPQRLRACRGQAKKMAAMKLRPACYHSIILRPWVRPEANLRAQRPHMEWAAAMGARLFLVHHLWVNYQCFNLSSARARARQLRFDLQTLESLGRLAREHRLRLVVENNPYFPPDYYLELIARLPTELCGAILDTGHANLQPSGRRVPLTEIIRRLGFRIEHLHLSDNDGVADQHLPLLCGHGTIDWRKTFAALKRAGYRGVLNEELPPMTGIAWSAWSVLVRKAQPLRTLWEQA